MNGPDLRRALLLFAFLVVGVMWALGPADNPRIAPGAQLGEITADLAGGGRFDLSEHRGEVVVLNFWATWCGPCRAEAPVLSRLHRSGVKVFGLSVDTLPLASVVRKARAIGIEYPIALGPADVIARLGIRSVPTTCVIGKDGTVATSHSGFLSHDALASAIAKAQRR
jgi:cytochrome c biogenesis protein CcmG, thiol:disulfide interchange protein DsbE